MSAAAGGASGAGLGHPSGELEQSDFFAIMAAFPTGVVVVTSLDADGRPKGLASNAFCSVSAAPPLVLVSVDRTSRTLPALRARRAFALNFLKEERGHVCTLFASKADDKFAGIAWRPGTTGMPILHEDTLAHAECVTEREIEAGDHVLLIGRVVGGRPPAPEELPLLYFRRCYGAWQPERAAEARGS